MFLKLGSREEIRDSSSFATTDLGKCRAQSLLGIGKNQHSQLGTRESVNQDLITFHLFSVADPPSLTNLTIFI